MKALLILHSPPFLNHQLYLSPPFPFFRDPPLPPLSKSDPKAPHRPKIPISPLLALILKRTYPAHSSHLPDFNPQPFDFTTFGEESVDIHQPLAILPPGYCSYSSDHFMELVLFNVFLWCKTMYHFTHYSLSYLISHGRAFL